MPRRKAAPAIDTANVAGSTPSDVPTAVAEATEQRAGVPPVLASDLSAGQTGGNESSTLLDQWAQALIHQTAATIDPHTPETAQAVARRVKDAYSRAKIALEVRKEFI